MANQKNRKQPSKNASEKQAVPPPPRRNAPSETFSEGKNEDAADEFDLDSLWEALGMDPPRAPDEGPERANPPPAQPTPSQTSSSSAPAPKPTVVMQAPSPAASSQAPASFPAAKLEKETAIEEPKPVLSALQVELEQKKFESEVNAVLQGAMKISGEVSVRDPGSLRPGRVDLKKLLQDRDEIQKAVILSEILGKPVGLR
ncbi:MAG: hypothetical protein RML49_05355 [Verrucomicrobiae bacterium]|nr:hypothetical protein [Verrucomicrobiae bacterium]